MILCTQYSQNKKSIDFVSNSLEGTWGANSSDERIDDGVEEGNVVDTAVDVEGIEELQEINQFERKSLEIPDKYFNDDSHRVVWAANKSGVKFTIDGWYTHLYISVILHNLIFYDFSPL